MPNLTLTTREAILGLLSGGLTSLTICSGTRPSVGGAITTVLATFDTLSGVVSGGVLTITSADVLGLAAGTATWARLTTTSGIIDISVSATGGTGECQLASLSVRIGVAVTLTELTITMPES